MYNTPISLNYTARHLFLFDCSSLNCNCSFTNGEEMTGTCFNTHTEHNTYTLWFCTQQSRSTCHQVNIGRNLIFFELNASGR